MNQSGQPRNSRKRGPMPPAPLTSGGLTLEEVTCRGWGPHLQYSFLIKLASLSGKYHNLFFFEPCANATGPSTGTCQHPTLREHTDKHKVTNIKQNFKSPSTTSQPPPGMGLIYMKNKGNRVEEEIKHRIIKTGNGGDGWVRSKSEFGKWGKKNNFEIFDESGPS